MSRTLWSTVVRIYTYILIDMVGGLPLRPYESEKNRLEIRTLKKRKSETRKSVLHIGSMQTKGTRTAGVSVAHTHLEGGGVGN